MGAVQAPIVRARIPKEALKPHRCSHAYPFNAHPLVRHAYAFEPDQRNLPALRRNAALCRNIQVIEKAVSSRNGTARLALGSGSTTNTLQPTVGATTIEVPVTTVDTFVAEHADIDVGLIKTDIEGHDVQALKGMERTVKRFQPLILSECGIEF